MVLTFSSKTWYEVTFFLLHNKDILLNKYYLIDLRTQNHSKLTVASFS